METEDIRDAIRVVNSETNDLLQDECITEKEAEARLASIEELIFVLGLEDELLD